MSLKLMDKYIKICKRSNKPITWSGLRQFKKSFK